MSKRANHIARQSNRFSCDDKWKVHWNAFRFHIATKLQTMSDFEFWCGIKDDYNDLERLLKYPSLLQLHVCVRAAVFIYSNQEAKS